MEVKYFIFFVCCFFSFSLSRLSSAFSLGFFVLLLLSSHPHSIFTSFQCSWNYKNIWNSFERALFSFFPTLRELCVTCVMRVLMGGGKVGEEKFLFFPYFLLLLFLYPSTRSRSLRLAFLLIYTKSFIIKFIYVTCCYSERRMEF